MEKKFTDVLANYSFEEDVTGMERIEAGHINETFRIITSKKEYILQRVNHIVFPKIEGLMDNIVRASTHVRQKLTEQGEKDIDRKVMDVVPTKTGQSYVTYPCNEYPGGVSYWRVVAMITEALSLDKIEVADQAYEGGKGYASYLNMLSDLDGASFVEVIEHFHDIEFRLEQFNEALANSAKEPKLAERATKAADMIAFVQQRAEDMCVVKRLGESGAIPLRLTHNDTKINNILFDADTQKALCVIDLDTIMPGYSLYDYGDAIRTGTNVADEDDDKGSAMSLEFYEAYTKGYIEGGKNFLTSNEVKHMPHAAKLFPYMIGVRFITDYLNGDVYFGIKHPEHNIQRCRAQMLLLTSMEKQFEQMQSIVKELAVQNNIE